MKYIYDNKTGDLIMSTYDNIEDSEIRKYYKNSIISNIYFNKAKVVNGNLLETYNSEMTVIYKPEDKTILDVKNGHFILNNSKVFTYNQQVINDIKYYYLNEDLELVLNEELKNKDLELKKLEEEEILKKNILKENEIKELKQQVIDLYAIIDELMEG